ncbi:hypothetical protein IAT40_007446 [Kwoniella sp. CBS 6097]
MGLLGRKSNEYNSSTENAPLTGHYQPYNASTAPTTSGTGAVDGNPYANGNAVLDNNTERNGYGGIFHGNKNKHQHQQHNGPLGGGGTNGINRQDHTTIGHHGVATAGNGLGNGHGHGHGIGNGTFGHHGAAAGAAVAPVAGAGSGQVNTGPVPLHGVSSGSAPSVKAAHKLERKGKMESTMGSLLCNSSLKHKSEAHLAQADHMRMQASELSEAERLEHEAGLRRQRAVGLGADPIHAHGVTGHGPGPHGAGAGAQVA